MNLYNYTAWSSAGSLILSRTLEKKTVIAAEQGADLESPELANKTLFFTIKGDQVKVLVQDERGKQTHKSAALGETLKLGTINWCITQTTNPATNEAEVSSESAAAFLQAINKWAAAPMEGSKSLESSLSTFLEIVLKRSRAENGMLILLDQAGSKLIATSGLSRLESQKLWDKMPEDLNEHILRSKAKVLLPDEFRTNSNNDTTVYIKGIKSMAGFPVFAEGRLVAIYYLGFSNLLTGLSREVQEVLESASELLGLVIQRAQYREQIDNLSLIASAQKAPELPKERLMVGDSKELVGIYDLIQRFAPIDVPTLIQGETGTGKELAAREIHRLSNRRTGPFIIVNAATLPDSLIESELFGHVKGSFTGALSDRIGLIEQADGGTLFIDEIGELKLELQSKLLRVLQEHTVTRLGDSLQRPINFRLICATHRDLNMMIKQSSFREDLYYRIAGALISLPALRDRKKDILTLANHFKNRFAERHGLEDKEWSLDAITALTQYFWPGNIRELENLVSRAFVMAEGRMIHADDLDIDDKPGPSKVVQADLPLNDARDAWMKEYIAVALKRHKGKRSDTAKALGVGERTLFRYIDQLGIKE